MLPVVLFAAAIGLHAEGQSLAPPGLPFPGGWDRMVARWSEGQAWKPMRMSIRSEELDRGGKVVSSEETWLALSYPEGPDKPRSTVLKALRDGVDVTAERRDKGAGRGPQGGPPGGQQDFPDPFPFGQAATGKASLSLLRGSPPGSEEFTYRIKGERSVVGNLRFSGGQLQELSYTIEPLPFYLGAFSGQVAFSSAPDGSLLASSLSFDADASFLLIRKHFRVAMSFESWAPLSMAVGAK